MNHKIDKITADAIDMLRTKKDISFLIVETKYNCIVDFASTIQEAGMKCVIADRMANCKCMFYETSLQSLDNLKYQIQNVKTDAIRAMKATAIGIEGFEYQGKDSI